MKYSVDLKEKIAIGMCLLTIVINPVGVYAQRGCCSRHGGVAGCNEDGRQICKDGTLSPSCTCTPTVKYVYGCTDKSAKNYNSKANRDNGECEYYIYGCMDPSAKNYDSDAEKDDNSCEYYKYGCTDANAENYDSSAEKDDGSCIIKTVEKTPIPEKELDEESKQEVDVDIEEETDPLDTMLGLLTCVGIGTGVYYVKTKKKKK